LQALCEDFEQNGIEAIKICRIEKPNEYLRLIAYCLPKELEVTIGPLQEISDQELERLIDDARRKLIDVTRIADIEGGEGEAAHGEPARLLPPI